MLYIIRNNPFARNSLILFVGTMVTNVFNYLFRLMAGRLVSPVAYGEIEALVSLFSIVSVPIMAVIMVATQLSACSKGDDRPQDTKGIFQLLSRKVTVYGVPVLLVLLALSPAIGSMLGIGNQWALVMVWFSLFLTFYGSINIGILNGWQRFRDSGIAMAWSAGAKLAVGAVFIMLGFQVSGALAGFVAAAVVIFFVSWMYLRPLWKVGSGQEISSRVVVPGSQKATLAFFLLGNLATNLLGNVDMVLAKRNLPEEIAGQYGALNVVAKIIFFATGAIATVAFSMLSENLHKKQNSARLLRQAVGLTIVLGVFAVGVYALFPKLLLNILFGQRYIFVAPYLVWFAIAASLYSLNHLLIQYFLSAKKKFVIYAILALSALMMGAIFLYGSSIFAIISIVIVTQVVALLMGLLFLPGRDHYHQAS